MARPKLGESETERLHVKITAEEINAIDDWRYSNRIPSRSEAVRRLMQIALACDKHLPDIKTHSERALDTLLAGLDQLSADEKRQIPESLRKPLLSALNEQNEACRSIVEAYYASALFSQVNNKDIEDLLVHAEKTANFWSDEGSDDD